MHVVPHHWNFGDDASRDNLTLWAYSNAPRVELLLNGKSLGVRQLPAGSHAEWNGVRWAAGRLEARALGPTADGTTEHATSAGLVPPLAADVVETSGAAAGLNVSVDFMSTEGSLPADGLSATLLRVTVVDSHGVAVPFASNLLEFSVDGAGELFGLGNGDPSSHEHDQASSRYAFNGLARALVRSILGRAGEVKLTVRSAGLVPGVTSFTTVAPEPRGLARRS